MTGSLFEEAYRRMPNNTDFSVFRDAGMTGYNFAYIGDVQHDHTPQDDLEHVDARSMQHHGANAWALVRRLGDEDISFIPPGEVVYFDLLGRLVVRWPHRMTWGLLGVAAALFGVTWVRWRRNAGVRVVRTVASALLPLVLLAASFTVAFGAAWLVRRGGGWPSAVLGHQWLAVGVTWSAALVAIAVVAAAARLVLTPGEIWLGQLLCLLVSSGAAPLRGSPWAPATSFSCRCSPR
jgi:hypothetical protein